MRAPGSPTPPKRRGEQHTFAAFGLGVLLLVALLWAAHAGAYIITKFVDSHQENIQYAARGLSEDADAPFLGLSSALPEQPPSIQPPSEALAPRPTETTQQRTIEASAPAPLQQTSETPVEKTKSIVAVLARYRDDLSWLESNLTGIMDNSTGATPRFILPIVIYQAADLAPDGHPTFPSLHTANASDSKEWPLPGWPIWATSWVEKKNATLADADPGSFEDAEREIRLKLGLPIIHTKADRKRIDNRKKDDDVNDAEVIMHPGGGQVLGRGGGKQGGAAGKTSVLEASELYVPGDAFKVPEGAPRSSVVSIPFIIDALPLHIIPNRGAEAMAYISYIIENYDSLPDIVLFAHGHRTSWHMLMPQDWSLRRLATHPPRNLTSYAPLGCQERASVRHGSIFPTAIDANFESPNGPRWHEALAARYAQAWREHLGQAFGGMELPDYVKIPCGASFAATREAIHRHPLTFYLQMRDWMLNTTIEGKWLGIVLEFTVGLILKGQPVVEFSQEECLCDLYSVCTAPADI